MLNSSELKILIYYEYYAYMKRKVKINQHKRNANSLTYISNSV